MNLWPFRRKPPRPAAAAPALSVEFGPSSVTFQPGPLNLEPARWLEELDPWPTDEHPRLLLLRQLLESGAARVEGSALEVASADLRELEDDDLGALGVAEPWPHRVLLSEGRDTFGMPGFRYEAGFRDQLGRSVPGLARQGCFLYAGEQRWFLSRPAYLLLEAVDEANAAAPPTLDEQLELWAGIRPLAEQAGAVLSPYLQSEEVVAPDSLDLRIVADEDEAVTACLTAPGLDETGLELRRKVDQSHVLKSVISFHRSPLDRVRLVARPLVHQALEQIRPLRNLRGPTKQQFLDRPEQFLTSPAVDLEHFSTALARAGIRRHRATPTIEGNRPVLRLEPEGVGEEPVELRLDRSEFQALHRVAGSRLEEGHLSLEYRGHLVRLEPALVFEMQELLESTLPKEPPAPQPSPLAPHPPEPPRPSTMPPEPDPESAQEPEPEEPREAPLVGGVPCDPFERPASLSPNVDLLLHQQHGLAWLQTLVRNGLAKGALLADDMGLGKTLQVWCFVEWYRETRPGHGPALLVLPAGLMDNWVEEYGKFFRGPGHLHPQQLFRLHGQSANAETLKEFPVVLTSYETMRSRTADLRRIRWSVIVADEAQKVKNPAARTTEALKDLAARFRVAMTGTPVENGLTDLWSLLDFAERGKLGPQKQFLDTHTPSDQSDYSSLARRIGEKASPCLLRRRKQDYLEGLPARHLHFVQLPMTDRQREDYQAAIREYRATGRGRQGLMDLLIRLRQLCCAAEGVEAGISPDVAAEASCKVHWMLDKLREIRARNEKALVFVEYKHLQRLIVSLLEREFGIFVGMINGDVKATGGGGVPSQRRLILQRFSRTEGFSVLVLSPLAAGVGLTIVEANHVIHFTRHWNPAKEDQATDRVYRIGQERDVHVYHPIAVGAGFRSLDERLHVLLEDKRRLQESALFPVASREVDIDKLVDVLDDALEDPFKPIKWDDVPRMDSGTFRRFVCALYARMGWTVERLSGLPLDARGHRDGERLALRCCAAGEHPPDHGEDLTLVSAVEAPPGPGLKVVGPQELQELLESYPVTWNDLLAWLPPEECLVDRAEKPGAPKEERPSTVQNGGPVRGKVVTPISESPAAVAEAPSAPQREAPPWLIHLPAALRLGHDLPTTRAWLAEKLAPHPEVSSRLPDVHKLPHLALETLARHAGRDAERLFRTAPDQSPDAALLPAGRQWRLYLREGLRPQEEVHLYLHAFAHRLLGHARDGDTFGHWDRLDHLHHRRWDREAESLLQEDYPPHRETASRVEERPPAEEAPAELEPPKPAEGVAPLGSTPDASRITPHQARYYAYDLTRRAAGGLDRLSMALFDAAVDLNPHQIEAALFALESPLSKGVLLADEVGLGKTIEAGLVLCQYWAERKRRLLVICPASLRKQWALELEEKFNLPARVLDAKAWKEALKDGRSPLEEGGVVIVSFHYAHRIRESLKAVAWDLAVIDEAHKLRNAYRPSNKVGQGIRWATDGVRKLLLTATPLQNSLLELYGLSTLIDEHHFGDVESFRSRYMGSGATLADLRQRLSTFCKRTLRKQVTEYVRYTERRPVTRPFRPGDDEHALYEAVSDFLQRPESYALPRRQRHLTALILRKLLASSSHAIAATLEVLLRRLEDLREEQAESDPALAELLVHSEEMEEDLLDEGVEEESACDEGSKIDPRRLQEEIRELRRLVGLARGVGADAKAATLLQALEVGFDQMERTGAARKAVVFTESRRTQDYLKSFLEARGYEGRVVVFNGTNSGPEATAVYEGWLEANRDTGRSSGSRAVDVRTALIEHFRDEAAILLATEAAAEGINLQFCSLVINYDLPWNPQRIEQRIGRCHRYGQKHDVVVINFLNERNEVDRRVLELLGEKFRLFDGVFGASDEVLGTLESGVDFEKRILAIYQECRTPEEIDAAFRVLQEEMDESVRTRMEDTRRVLLEHFDEDVHEKLRVQLAEARDRLDRVGRRFWTLTRFMLGDRARFDEGDLSFDLHVPPAEPLRPGRYHLVSHEPRQAGGEPGEERSSFLYRLSHPLGEHVLQAAQDLETAPAHLVFDITGHPNRVHAVEALKGRSGHLAASRVVIDSYEREEALLFSGFDDDGAALDQETMEKLFGCSASLAGEWAVPGPARDRLAAEADLHVKATLNRSLEENTRHFQQARERLEKWAEDMVLSAEKALRDTKEQIKALRRQARQAVSLEEQHAAQKKMQALEQQQRRQRQEIFAVEDEITEKRDGLIESLEGRLAQRTTVETLFTVRWSVV